MIGLIALLLTLQPASAGLLAVSASAGSDFGTQQRWAGLDIAWHDDGAAHWSPVARLTPAYGFQDRRGLALVDLGFTWVIPRKQPLPVRVGLLAQGVLMDAPYRLPWEVRDKPEHHLGMVPSLQGLIEFEYGEENLFIFGVRGGAGSAASAYLCDVGESQERCLAWFSAFVGAFYVRGRIGEYLYLEGVVGPSLRGSIGAAF